MGTQLDALIAAGHARIESDGMVTGFASDGTECALGAVWNAAQRARLSDYLADFPTPDMW